VVRAASTGHRGTHAVRGMRGGADLARLPAPLAAPGREWELTTMNEI
jgi:hypothetical protein